jgi:flagellar protein FlaG
MDTLSSLQSPLAGGVSEPAVSNQRVQAASAQKSVPGSMQVLAEQRAREQDSTNMDVEKLRELVGQTNASMEAQNRRLLFSVYEDTGTQMVQVFDRDTDKLVRQFPPEEYLGVVKQIQQMGPEDVSGLMLKEQA